MPDNAMVDVLIIGAGASGAVMAIDFLPLLPPKM
jgi:cation diffusion facilitator CzcD-associated flavoprotein CzcO